MNTTRTPMAEAVLDGMHPTAVQSLHDDIREHAALLWQDATHVDFYLQADYAPQPTGLRRHDEDRFRLAAVRSMTFNEEMELSYTIADAFALLYEVMPNWRGIEVTPYALRLDLAAA